MLRSFNDLLMVLVIAGFANPGLSKMKSNTVILKSYASLAERSYATAQADARILQKAILRFVKKPEQQTYAAAKTAWLAARESYGQTEIFRLTKGPIDADSGWVFQLYGNREGQINAWPLDENLIDYTIDESGKRTEGHIIGSSGSFKPGGHSAKIVDVTHITKAALAALNENGSDANVAAGYHAIEFLLWGQDQDYGSFKRDQVTHGALKAGRRPLSDFTTDKFAKRRLAYLEAAVDLLVEDVEAVSLAWQRAESPQCQKPGRGCYRAAFLGQLTGQHATKNLQTEQALRQMISGMGVFMKSELANERIAVAVLTPSEEDEHSCFSDNTHRDITMNYQGFMNVLKGQFGGKNVGKSLYDFVQPATRKRIDTLTKQIEAKIAQMNALAMSKWHFDYQILPGNNAKELRHMKNLMRQLGDVMVIVAKDLKILLNVSDVTDHEETKL